MKTSEEMIADLLNRRNRYMTDKTIKRKKTIRITSYFLSMFIVALLGFGSWHIGLFDLNQNSAGNHSNGTNTPDKTDQGTIDTGKYPTANDTEISKNRIIWAENDVNQAYDGFTVWSKYDSVSFRLHDALESGTNDDIFAILARPSIDYTFNVDGKTIAEYYSDMCEEQDLPGVLTQLLKEGDYLKYGKSLYETGTPDGEIWARSLYEEQVKFYGSNILETYIVDGQFLKEKLEQDIVTAANNTEATDAYEQAKSKYFDQLAVTVHGSLPSQAAPQMNGIIIFLTKNDFSELSLDNIEGWTFDLAVKDNETYVYVSSIDE